MFLLFSKLRKKSWNYESTQRNLHRTRNIKNPRPQAIALFLCFNNQKWGIIFALMFFKCVIIFSKFKFIFSISVYVGNKNIFSLPLSVFDIFSLLTFQFFHKLLAINANNKILLNLYVLESRLVFGFRRSNLNSALIIISSLSPLKTWLHCDGFYIQIKPCPLGERDIKFPTKNRKSQVR